MNNADDTGRLRKEAEAFLETAVQLFRKKRYPQMLHHCYLALQCALEASFVATHGGRAPASVSLVVIGQALGRQWSDRQRELLVELTECVRAIGEGNVRSVAVSRTKEGCLRSLTMTGSLIAELR